MPLARKLDLSAASIDSSQQNLDVKGRDVRRIVEEIQRW